MKRHEAERLITVIRELAAEDGAASVGKPTTPAGARPGASAVLDAKGLEDLYQTFRARLIDEAKLDPILLHLLTTRPEIILEFEPQVVRLDGSTLKGRIARLIAAGWFSTTRATGAVRKELARTGADPGGGGTLSDNLGAMVRDGFLVRSGDGYEAASGVKITEKVLETRPD